MVSASVNPVRLVCQQCGEEFMTRYKRRKCCSEECCKLYKRTRACNKERPMPTPEEISEMCKKFRTGELVANPKATYTRPFDNYDPSAYRRRKRV